MRPSRAARPALALAAPLLLTFLTGCPRSEPRVVLYSAQDQEFAAGLLDDFKQRTGLAVAPKYDTEANKSVSLYVELLSEKDRPRCDVFWNNEILATIRLQRQGLLEPYDSPAAKPYPASAKAADHTWYAFAARPRILIVNTELVPEAQRPRSLLDLTAARWRRRAVMARPQFGTSATQAACLFAALGPDKARDFYHGLKANDVQLAPGNKQVAEWVGRGRTPRRQPAAVGVTDPDDALAEVRAGKPVAIILPDQEAAAGGPLGTLFIPNTLMILKGCPNPAGARRLVDYLLGPEVEAKLAESDSHQVPLNPEVKAKLPKELEGARTARHMQVDFGKAADLWDESQKCVLAEFGGP
jgi:iron(III) transport system substrate-binding protein